MYDTIRKKSLTWTQKLSDQLNLAHVARQKNMKKRKLKQQTTFSSVQQIEASRIIRKLISF